MSIDSPFLVRLSITGGHLPLCHPTTQPGSLHPHPIADAWCWGLPVCVHGMGAEAENPAGSFLPSHEHPLHYLLVSNWGFCSISPPKKGLCYSAGPSPGCFSGLCRGHEDSSAAAWGENSADRSRHHSTFIKYIRDEFSGLPLPCTWVQGRCGAPMDLEVLAESWVLREPF